MAAETVPEEPKRKSRSRGGRRKRSETVAVTADNDNLGNLFDSLPNGAPDQAPAPADHEDDGELTTDASRSTKGLGLIMETVGALVEDRGEEQKIWGSMVKQTLRRRRPGFNERFYGFRSFNAMLEEAAERGWLTLERDTKSGGYSCTRSKALTYQPWSSTRTTARTKTANSRPCPTRSGSLRGNARLRALFGEARMIGKRVHHPIQPCR